MTAAGEEIKIHKPLLACFLSHNLIRRGKACASQEGTANAAGNVFGTYIHGVFDNDVFRRSVLNAIRHSKGLEALANTRNVMAEKQKAYEHLADVVENALDMEKLYQIMGEKTC